MAVNLAAANNQALAAALNTAIGTSAIIQIYNGTAPTNADTAIGAQTLLVTLTGNASGFGVASGGVITLNAVTSGTAVATNTATFARILTSGSVKMLDLTNIASPSGGDINLNTLTITSGGTVSLTSGTITFPYP